MGGLVIFLMILFVMIRYAKVAAEKAKRQQQAQGPQPAPTYQPGIPVFDMPPPFPVFDVDELEMEGTAGEEGQPRQQEEAQPERAAIEPVWNGRPALEDAYVPVGGTLHDGLESYASLERAPFLGEGESREGEDEAEHALHLQRMDIADEDDAYRLLEAREDILDLRVDRESAALAFVYSEVLTKPKALRRLR